MDDASLPLPGATSAPGDLRIVKARDLADIVRPDTLPYVHLIECRRCEPSDGDEIVVLAVEVELPQRKQAAIERVERIAIRFSPGDETYPEILALRPDFPLLPHLNQRVEEFPRSLCIYDEPYDEVRLHWTPVAFVERIRTWLARVARGDLHLADQPLEPLLMGSPYYLMIPPSLSTRTGHARPDALIGYAIEEAGGVPFFVVRRATQQGRDAFKDAKSVAMVLEGKPQVHGVIRRTPQNVSELHALMATAGDDFLGDFRTRLQRWQGDPWYSAYRNKGLLLVLRLPKTRTMGGPVEAIDLAAFLCDGMTVKQVGEQIGVRDRGRGGAPQAINGARRGECVPLTPLQPVEALSRPLAAQLNGCAQPDNPRIALVGAGAVGSQLFDNLARTGFGAWAIVDRDRWLPHNFARNPLSGAAIGRAKATALAAHARQIVGDLVITPVVADVLHPGENSGDLKAAFRDANVILDTSASVAVARHLARDVASVARRISFFLNPSGSDAVMLGEDTARSLPLDHLEMEYYRALLHEPGLAGHLEAVGESIAYVRGCHDRTSRIPQDRVALHTATGSRALRKCLGSPDASIAIWRATEDGEVARHCVAPSACTIATAGAWTLSISDSVLTTARRARAAKGANETGGVLIGAIDASRKVIYVADVLLSPPDSEEWPTCYIRGCVGLAARVAEIERTTLNMFGYLGEWHSHSPGHSCAPSRDDRRAFTWLADEVARDGQPPLMLIVGDGGEVAWFVGEMP